MSVHEALTAALVATLRGDPACEGVGVFDAPPVRASPPFVEVTPPILADWGAKDRRGVEARLLIRIEDAGERPVRVRTLADAVGGVVAAGVAVPGWESGTAVLARSRIARRGDAKGDGRWIATIEFRMRLLESV
ncbi:tail completion protein gp17 [Sphingomonas japonica]|uniref:DUF3168 domain-containing protein n=1 Tax=Sphingomonas japonica TaxID=511662 RepID=A0ABX0TZI3_9SPHN|nr:DUF3168 domain-containing protein [Sphingomonas japonica]NIJ23731.1 hypothetical protein [Sphingomonas japonica]